MFKYILPLLLLLTSSANAEIWGINQILEATCRVQSGNSFGSGSCISFKDGNYYILTNAHVVGRSSTVKLEFFKNGMKTLPFPAKVVWKNLVPNSEIDFALVEVDGRLFGKYPPRIAKIAPPDADFVGGYVVSAGCPGARWPSGWEGFVINQEDGTIKFYPPPLGGQSGSGLYVIAKTEDGYETYLKGVITWRIGGGIPGKTSNMGYEDNHGGAIVIDRLIDALEGRVGDYSVPEHYEPVIFRKHNYPLQPVQQTQKQTVPYIQVQKTEVIDRNRLLPIIPRPTPEDDVNPEVVPDLDVDPAPAPNEDNPYGVLPDFNIPKDVVPPIADELKKAEEEKAKLEAEKKAAEEEKARLEAEKEAALKAAQEEQAKLEAEKKEAEEQSELYAWIASLTGGGGLGALLLFLLRKYLPKVAVSFYSKKKDKIKATIDKTEDELFEELLKRLNKVLPEEIAEPIVDKARVAEEELIKKLEQRFLDRLKKKIVAQPVSIEIPQTTQPAKMTLHEAQDESLNEVAKAILDNNARLALQQFVNKTITDMFEDR